MERGAMERAFKMMLANNVELGMSRKCKLKIVPLVGLVPLELREMHSQQEEMCYEGRVIYGIIRASAKSGSRGMVLCVLESEDGVCALLNIYNALKSSEGTRDAENLFPKGVRVAVKEPVGYKHCLHVSCPASVEFAGIGRRLKYRSLEDLRNQGNMFFSEGNLILAELYYTECIKLCISKGKNREEEFVTMLSNRAETKLKLGKFEEAILDADTALEIDPKHVKSFARKGRGFRAIQEHKQALVCFEAALKVCTEKVAQDLEEEVRKCKDFLRQSQHGEYDITNYLLSGMDVTLVPECSDFMGPVELKMTPDGRGRGLFATKDLKVGDLLIVSNPIASSTSGQDSSPGQAAQEQDFDEQDLFVELLRACMSSDRSLRQIYALPDSHGVNELPQDVEAFYTDVGKLVQVPKVLDIDRIRRIQEHNAFSLSRKGGGSLTGIWSSVSFINHCCLPNVAKVGHGPVVIVRASRKLKAGDELLFSYPEALSPWSHRKQIFASLGFECRCRRCSVERAYEAVFADIPHLAYSREEELIHSELVIALEIEKRLTGIAGALTDEQMDWFRAGYANLYAACMNPSYMTSFVGGAAAAGPRYASDPRALQISRSSTGPALRSHEQILKALHETAPGNTQTLSRMVKVYSHRPSGSGKKLVAEECTALYGKQQLEVVDAIIRWMQED